MLAESMRPAIIKFSALNGDVLNGNRGDSSGGDNLSRKRGRDDRGIVGAMVASVAGGEATNAFLVAHLEFGLEKVESPFRAVGRKRNFSVVEAKRPVFSSIANVRVMTVMSGIGTVPRAATRWILAILDHKSSIGSSRFHGSERAARLRSSSSGVIVPYSLRRCCNMARGVTSPKPKSGSSSALKKEALTAERIWAVRAARRLVYKVTSTRASVYARIATAMAAAVPAAIGGGPGWSGTSNATPTRAM